MDFVERFAILTSITWNSNHWQEPLTDNDISHSKYDFVCENLDAIESINFGHELYPSEPGNAYIGYSPMLDRNIKEQRIAAAFFLSSDYRHQNAKRIVGVYAFPTVGSFERTAKHSIYKRYAIGNVRAQVEDIIYFRKPVTISNVTAVTQRLLPGGKAISQQGFNYLTSENTRNILRLAIDANPRDTKLAALLERFTFTGEITPSEADENLTGLPLDADADTSTGIEKLEAQMQKLKPSVKLRVSSFIERGSIALAVKYHTGYKCLLCEALDQNPIGFIKRNGIPYVETHHVDPVSNGSTGSLGLANIITVCANHHRQLHYGNVQIVKITSSSFRFRIDGVEVTIK